MKTEEYILIKEIPRHLDEIYNFALWMTGNGLKAEKMTLLITREAVRFYDYHKPADLKKWLLGITLNVYEKNFRNEEASDSTFQTELLVSDPDAGKEILRNKISSLKEKELADKLMKLPSYLRLILVLREITGLNYSDISEITDIPVGAVIKRLGKSRKILYNFIDKP